MSWLVVRLIALTLLQVCGDLASYLDSFNSHLTRALTSSSNYYIVQNMETKTDLDKKMVMFYQKSKEHDLKLTFQRAAIYEELLRAKDHPTADVIYKRIVKKIPNISFDTVNRTLLTFSKIGITNVVEGYGQAKRYDPDTVLHHHFRCIHCGSIIDLYSREFDNITVPDEIHKQFTVINKKVVLEGLCNKCRKR